MPALPALFVSHGAPTLVLDDVPARRFLTGLGPTLGRPEAVVVLSAHWGTAQPTVGAGATFETIHDFYGFPEQLFRLRYPASGAPALAAEIAERLDAAGLAPRCDERRGLDHGAWVPLMLMWPDADVPVVPVSIQPERNAAHHWRIGEALRPLRDRNILILASGAATHNLGAYFRQGTSDTVPEWVSGFTDWLADRIAAADTAALLGFEQTAPYAAANHPTTEHLLPLFAALGAGTPGHPGQRIHASLDHGVLAMDAYSFG
jgi:4,5-DOPA dioxygenase extradiol